MTLASLLDALKPGKIQLTPEQIKERRVMVQTEDGFLATVVAVHEKDEMTISLPGTEEERRVAASKLCDVIPLSDFESLLKECGVTGFASEWTRRCHGTGGGEKKQDFDDAPKPKTLGDMFKAKEGQWRCSTCMTMNDATAAEKCAACETAKPGAAKPAAAAAAAAAGAASGLQFGFGAAPAAPASSSSPAPATSAPKTLGDMFKAKEGDWRCSTCMTMNPATASDKCLACEAAKPGAAKPAAAAASPAAASGLKFGFGAAPAAAGASSPAPGGLQFSFGGATGGVAPSPASSPAPAAAAAASSPAPATSAPKTLGDMFKAKEGDWRCSTCMTMNPATASDKCLACETAKPGAAKPHAAAAAAGAASGLQFGFGAAPAAPSGLQFGFGAAPAAASSSSSPAPATSAPKTLGDMFKAKEGDWRCSTCMTMNDATAAEKCAACETAKPGAAKPAAAAAAAAAAGAASGLQFGFGTAPAAPSGLQFGFGGTPASGGAADVSANVSTSLNRDQEDVDENDDMDEASSMDESSSLLDSEDYDSDVGGRGSESTGVSPAPATSAPKTLGDMFKAKEGDWRCSTCMTMNPATASDKCLACETAKPGAAKPAAAAASPAAASGLKFGFGAAPAAPAAASSPAPGGLQFGFGGTPASGGAAASGSGLTFGFGAASESAPKSESTTQAAESSAPAGGSTTFGFGAASGGQAPKFNFGSGAAPSSTSTSSQGNPPAFSFGSSAASSQPSFSFGGSAPDQPPAFSFGAPPK